MSEWQPIETAPKDGQTFLAWNYDREIWPAKYLDDGRLCFRHNFRSEPRRFEVRRIDGEEFLKEDRQFAEDHERWRSTWTLWTRLYEFKPSHWMPLPEPPASNPV